MGFITHRHRPDGDRRDHRRRSDQYPHTNSGHKTSRTERRASKAALAQTGYGHSMSSTIAAITNALVTVEDPATSRFGESLYHFVPRSLVGSVRSAWALEVAAVDRAGRTRWNPATTSSIPGR